ncbi:hypothetical protein BC830DRAFT_1109930 [Chytriomyces sp. MP71]|nr:hypothetical protein BC830DRAFT_1109930 [Chytriomyces sp. MP71]
MGLCLDDYNLLTNEGNTIGLWNCNGGWNQIWAHQLATTTTTSTTTSTSTTSSTTSTLTSTTSTSTSSTSTSSTSSTTTTINACPVGAFSPLQLYGLPFGASASGTIKAGTSVALSPYSQGANSMFAFDCQNRLVILSDTSLCIGAKSTTAGSTIALVKCSDAGAISWTHDDTGHFHPYGNSQLCLDDFGKLTNIGNRIGLWGCNGGWNQIWSLSPPAWTTTSTSTTTTSTSTRPTTSTTTSSTTTTTASSAPTSCPIGDYKPLQVNNRTLIATTKLNSTGIGAKIVLWEYNLNPTSLFAFDCLNRLHIQANPVACIGAQQFKMGTPLSLVSCNSSTAIQWVVTGDTFRVSGIPMLVMDNYQLKTDNGNTIGLWGFNGGWNQRWAVSF